LNDPLSEIAIAEAAMKRAFVELKHAGQVYTKWLGSALTLDKTAGYSRSGPSGTNDIVQDGTAPQNPVEIPPDNDTEEAEGRNEHRLLRWFSSSWGRIVGFFQRSDRQAPK
jgi:hypothetical protein